MTCDKYVRTISYRLNTVMNCVIGMRIPSAEHCFINCDRYVCTSSDQLNIITGYDRYGYAIGIFARSMTDMRVYHL